MAGRTGQGRQGWQGGHGSAGEEAGKVLNRIITVTGDGFELAADPRHSEMIVEQLGVSGFGGITTAGC